jgi:pimeloyl-ACP methyl ester carboxylesterase
VEEIGVGGLTIKFRRAGNGPPLILLHGAFSDSREWRRQLDALSDEFTVVAWDAPGFGASSDPPDTFRSADYAHCLAGLIEALALDRPHVLGLSFGGILALEFYRWYPTIPRTLVLASTYAGWAGSLPPEVVEQRLLDFWRQLDLPPEERVSLSTEGLFTPSAPTEVIEEAMAISHDFHPGGMRVMANNFARLDLRPVLPLIEVPTLLLWGEVDQRSPVSVGEDLHAKIPDSKLVVMPGVGHQSNMEAPERFNREVRDFLRSANSLTG